MEDLTLNSIFMSSIENNTDKILQPIALAILAANRVPKKIEPLDLPK